MRRYAECSGAPRRVKPGELVPFSNSMFEGALFFNVHANPLPPPNKKSKTAAAPEPPPGQSYYFWELQVQGKFKKDFNVWFMGIELTAPLKLSLVSRAIAMTLLKFVRSFEPDTHATAGEKDMSEVPHMVTRHFRGIDFLADVAIVGYACEREVSHRSTDKEYFLKLNIMYAGLANMLSACHSDNLKLESVAPVQTLYCSIPQSQYQLRCRCHVPAQLGNQKGRGDGEEAPSDVGQIAPVAPLFSQIACNRPAFERGKSLSTSQADRETREMTKLPSRTKSSCMMSSTQDPTQVSHPSRTQGHDLATQAAHHSVPATAVKAEMMKVDKETALQNRREISSDALQPPKSDIANSLDSPQRPNIKGFQKEQHRKVKDLSMTQAEELPSAHIVKTVEAKRVREHFEYALP
ncbi:MAG: hypothetical protein SGPRY_007431 [Prymnesium sp.]